MDDHRVSQWQGGPAWKIMRDARRDFRASKRKHPASSRVTLASTHWTIAGRRNLMTPWHTMRAALLVKKAIKIKDGLTYFRPSQIDVITSILARTPAWLGGDIDQARRVLEYAVENMKMKPHTAALMWCTLGGIYTGKGDALREHFAYEKAAGLLPEIETEDSDDRDEQAIRVRRKVGLHFYNRGDQDRGLDYLRDAYRSACLIAKDQVQKIETECRDRDINLAEWCS